MNGVVYWVRMIEELATLVSHCRCSSSLSSDETCSDWLEKVEDECSFGERDDDGGWELGLRSDDDDSHPRTLNQELRLTCDGGGSVVRETTAEDTWEQTEMVAA